MLMDNIEEQCRRISPDAYSKKSVCTFAPRKGIVGFIDTSGVRDGSRGIAFYSDKMCVNTDGVLHEIAYRKIIYTHIISSFEDSFADELSVSAKGIGELRISDYSLDKIELKRLLDELRQDPKQVGERNAELAEEYADIVAHKLAEKAQNRDAKRIETAARELKKSAVVEENPVIEEYAAAAPVILEERPPIIVETVVDIPEERSPLPKDHVPTPIPEGKIDWISGAGGVSASVESDVRKTENHPENEAPPKQSEVISGVTDGFTMIVDRKHPNILKVNSIETIEDKKNVSAEKPTEASEAQLDDLDDEPKLVFTEKEMRERIESMSPDEMMAFLSETLKEINTPSGAADEQTAQPSEQPDMVLQTVGSTETNEMLRAIEAENAPEEPKPRWEKLTTEPIWGDIYIKASQSLRQLCESGRLTMEQMEDELRARLLSAAEAFEQITGDNSRVPKVMIPKITELKLAADNFDSYFSYGEDVAIRAMFFMLYQMLTYADRIAESPETKDRLNDFFRRFGSAGITLSMLDMRV